MKNWADALTPLGVGVIERAERGEQVDADYLTSLPGIVDEDDAEEFFTDFNNRLYRMLQKHMQGTASSFASNKSRSGVIAWKEISGHFDPQDQAGKNAAYNRVTNPGKRAKDVVEARKLVREWIGKVDEYEAKYQSDITDQQKISTLMGILPTLAVDNVFRAKAWTSFQAMQLEVNPWLEYRSVEEANKESKVQDHNPDAMDLSSMMQQKIEEMEEKLLAQMKGNGKGGGKGGGKAGYQKGQLWKGGKGFGDRDENGRFRKGEKAGGKGAKGKGEFKGECYICGKWGHSAKFCKTKESLNTFTEAEHGGGLQEGEQAERCESEEHNGDGDYDEWGYLMALTEEKNERSSEPPKSERSCKVNEFPSYSDVRLQNAHIAPWGRQTHFSPGDGFWGSKTSKSEC